MFIQGHIEIIKRLMPKNYFDLPNFPDFSLDLLLKGIEYVDAPCGTYNIKDGRVVFVKNKENVVCSIFSLVDLFNEKVNGETELFQHHKGFFAHLHAMTTDPDHTILNIRNKIITSVLGYSLLAVSEASAFFAGMVLHIITDSYSPSHTIRDKSVKTMAINADKDNMDPDRQMRLAVHEHLKSLAKNDTLYTEAMLMRKLLSKTSKQNSGRFITQNKNHLWEAYKTFKFEYNLNKQVATFAPNDVGAMGPERDGDIIAFQYYDYQPLLLHMKLDLLRYVKPKSYKRMQDECIAFLDFYKKAMKSGDILTFLKRVRRLMLQGTFRIHNRYLKEKTCWIVRP
jgi:hypothetical protein